MAKSSIYMEISPFFLLYPPPWFLFPSLDRSAFVFPFSLSVAICRFSKRARGLKWRELVVTCPYSSTRENPTGQRSAPAWPNENFKWDWVRGRKVLCIETNEKKRLLSSENLYLLGTWAPEIQPSSRETEIGNPWTTSSRHFTFSVMGI
jgi:hypothetical protein